jgi:hypothetical protein
VVALSSNDVWAVGWKFSLELFWHVPFALHWNGSTWSEVSVPVSSPQGGRLFGVSGSSASSVVAVGSGGAGTLIMRWDGSRWAVEPIRVRSTVANLWDVSVAASTFAVGNTQQLSGGILTPSRTFAVRSGAGPVKG